MAQPFSVLRVFVAVGLSIGLFGLGRVTAPTGTSSAAPAVVLRDKPLVVAPGESEVVRAEVALSKTQVEVWKQRLDGIVPSEARDEETLRMIAAWAGVNPREALDYAQKNLTKDRQAQALAAVFAAWAKKDPSEAWNFVLAIAPPQPQHLRSVLSEVSRNDPPLAQSFAAVFAQQHPEQALDVYLCVLDGVIHSGKYQDAVTLIDHAATRDDEQKAMLINFLGGQWARYQPDKAAPWVLGLPPGPARDQAIDALGQAWSDRDPLGAANFAVTLPPGPLRQTALKQAISKWTLDDPAQASRWVLKFDAHEDFDQAVASIATSNGLMYQNLNLALNWSASILDESLRTQTTTTIVSNWYSNDPIAALKYIKTSPDLNAHMREALLKIVPPPAPDPSAVLKSP